MIGRTIGNYVVRAKVGEGGMGVVYRAEHPQINRRVAIKVLHPGVDRNPEVVHRFFNEAKAATEIRNEHIVEVLDFGELPEGTPYLVMEWLEGQSLGDVLRAEPRQSVARTAAVVRGIAQALKAAHAKGVIHRDLKPDNVFLVQREADQAFIKVLDFGIAKLIQAGDSNRYQTQTGAIIGTPAYMSPEQCRGAKEIDTRTDVYSLGVIAYQMLTGRLPFNADALGELLFKHLTEEPLSPIALNPGVPVAVSAIVALTLEKDPDKRPSLAKLSSVMDAAAAEGGLTDGFMQQAASTAATISSAASSPIASATTLSGAASELGLERSLHKPKRGRLMAAVVLLAGAATAAVVVVVRRSPPPPSVAERTPPAGAPVINPPSNTKTPPNAPAPAAGIAERRVVPVRIQIRTEPAAARLEIDGQTVANPMAMEGAPGSSHSVIATLPGFGSVQEPMTLDHDRELVLKLVPAEKARAALPPPREGHPRKIVVPKEAADPAGKSSGYHGSKLKIETDFP